VKIFVVGEGGTRSRTSHSTRRGGGTTENFFKEEEQPAAKKFRKEEKLTGETGKGGSKDSRAKIPLSAGKQEVPAEPKAEADGSGETEKVATGWRNPRLEKRMRTRREERQNIKSGPNWRSEVSQGETHFCGKFG